MLYRFIIFLIVLVQVVSCSNNSKNETSFIILHSNYFFDTKNHSDVILRLKDSLSEIHSGVLFINTASIAKQEAVMNLSGHAIQHIDLTGYTQSDLFYGGVHLLEQLATNNIPVVSANVLPRNKKDRHPLPYIVLKRNGIKIAFLGYTPTGISNQQDSLLYSNSALEFCPIEESTSFQQMAITQSNINIAILQSENTIVNIKESVPDIDVVLGLSPKHYVPDYKQNANHNYMIATNLIISGKELKEVNHYIFEL